MVRVYLETSFFSECATIRTGAIDLGRRATSLRWWQTQAKSFELFISNEVIRELSDPDFPEAVRVPALAMMSGLNALPLDPEVISLADLLVRERVMPAPSVEGDAIHLAVAAVHRIDYLLTWNQKHLANPNKRTHLAVICARVNLVLPQIVTPDLLIVEDNDE
jgi:predicted nucleic acid-binding protein